MSDPALDYVHDVLLSCRERGLSLRASVESLARLASTRSQPPAPTAATPAPKAVTPVTTRPVEPRPTSARSDESYVRVAPLTGSNFDRLEAMRKTVLACEKCQHLVKSRTQVVFGVGNPEAELMFVGEAPGEDEDHQGEPFVGKAGQLLTKIIETMGFARSSVFIANILKCRPDMPPGATGNRKPRPDEMATCFPYLREQIEIIRPRALVALGATAMEGLTGQSLPMARLRGRWHDFDGTPLMATYHPAYLLRNQALSEKRKVWEDMLLVLEKLSRPITEKQQTYFLRKS